MDYNRIAHMEALLEVLSRLAGVSTTTIATKLMDSDIQSWQDFKAEVEKRAGEVLKQLT